MSDERRYTDEEVHEIFGLAATPRDARERAPSPAEGLTLAELQAIGREVGLAPARIAEAATTLELRRSVLPRQTSLGMPIGVSRVVTLPRAPTDREWAQLVAELRGTFDATGVDRSHGELRQWANGNLRAYVEPVGDQHQLRLRTRKGDAASLNAMGLAFLVMALALLLTQLVRGTADAEWLGMIVLTLSGAAAIGANALRLPGWAREREAQMEQVAARATALLSAPTDDRDAARPARAHAGNPSD